MGVTLNPPVGTETYQNAVTSKTFTYTVSPGSNLALAVTLNFGAAVSGVSVVWDDGGTNQSMTQVALINPNPTSAVFGLRNPTVGTKLGRVSWTGLSEVFIAPICFSTVDTSADAAAFPHTATHGPGAASTILITSDVGHMVVGTQASSAAQGTQTGTSIYSDQVSGAVINAQAEYDTGAPTVNIGSTGLNQTIAAIDVAPAGSGGSVVPLVMMHRRQMG